MNYAQRKSPRLQGYDYSQSGAYFVTICTENRLKHFGAITNDRMFLNTLGQTAYDELANIPQHWQNVDVDLFVVMPNHVHVIVVLHEVMNSMNRPPILGNITGGYKAGVSRIARKMGHLGQNLVLWQERYNDHIIRNERSLNYIRNYVATNPERWEKIIFTNKHSLYKQNGHHEWMSLRTKFVFVGTRIYAVRRS